MKKVERIKEREDGSQKKEERRKKEAGRRKEGAEEARRKQAESALSECAILEECAPTAKLEAQDKQ